MEEYYQPAPKETVFEKINIFLGKKGPYILRSIVQFVVGIIVWTIKFIKSMLKDFWEVMKGAISS